jgi:hypothetical protein
LFAGNYLGVKFLEERIVIVKALRDRSSAQLIDLKNWNEVQLPRLRYTCIRYRC